MVAQSTLDKYNFFLKKFSNLDILKPNDNVKYLQSYLNKKNNHLSISTIKLIISAFIWKLKNDCPDIDENIKLPVINEYKKLLATFKIETDKIEKNHSNIHGYIPEWDDIIKKRDSLKNAKNYKEYLILSLFTYIPPRRLTDYTSLKYVPNESDMGDRKFNYYVKDTSTFIFNVFKTSKSFHSQVIKSPIELSEIIETYVIMYKINNGGLLLNMHDYHQLHYILNKLLGCSVDNIRHSFISYSYKNKIPDSDTLENNATSMAHSLSTHLRYRKNI